MDIDHAYEQAKTTAMPGAIDDLDRELDRTEKAIGALEERLAPITNQYLGSEKVMHDPRAEPATQMRSRIERLHILTERLEGVTGRIDL